jgi:site-specific recombinase XerD
MDSIRLDPERPALDARHLDALIEMWLQNRRRRLAAKTAADYADKIRYFRDWWKLEGPTVDWQLSEETLLDFNKHLSERISRFGQPLAYHTRKDALRRLKQVLLWAYEKNHTTNNYSKFVPAPEGSAPARQAAPLDCLRRLVEATAQSSTPTRDRAILAILLGTGVRRSECASINVELVRINADGSGDLQVEAKRVTKREVHRRTVAFDGATGKYIRAHLDTLIATTGPLFPSQRPEQSRLTPVGVYRVVKKLIKLAGLDDQIQGPHDLRRLFATYYSRNRRGESHGQLLSKQLGHSTYRMTAHYSLQDVEDIRAVIVSPFSLLDDEDAGAKAE